MLRTLTNSLVGLVFPSTCENCTRLLSPHQSGVCAECKSRIRLIAAPHCPTCGRTHLLAPQSCEACRDESFAFDRAYACTAYDGFIKKMLRDYKFEGRKSLKPFFAGLMMEFVLTHNILSHIDAVVAVPMNPRKEKDRGFNQASLLGSALAQKTKKPFIKSALYCRKDLIPQSALGRSERKQHVRGAFEARDRARIQNQRLLLVDDILTTGQTASECAKALKNAGAVSVTVLAVARGI